MMVSLCEKIVFSKAPPFKPPFEMQPSGGRLPVAPEGSGDETLNAKIHRRRRFQSSLLLKGGGAERRKIECLAEA